MQTPNISMCECVLVTDVYILYSACTWHMTKRKRSKFRIQFYRAPPTNPKRFAIYIRSTFDLITCMILVSRNRFGTNSHSAINWEQSEIRNNRNKKLWEWKHEEKQIYFHYKLWALCCVRLVCCCRIIAHTVCVCIKWRQWAVLVTVIL